VPIREELEAVMAGVATARSETFKTHSLAARIKHEWRDAVAAVVDDDSYKIEGSPGKGRWAESVWLGVFDRTVTETAQRGFYVVYLVAPDGSRTFLSLEQGTTEITTVSVGVATSRSWRTPLRATWGYWLGRTSTA